MRLTGEPSRFQLLDVLRGLAALSVVLWHWQHFFKPFNPVAPSLIRERQPGFEALRLFYEHGNAAVGLFFCLSGFIFFLLYADRILRREVGFGRFVALRLSRLYPLHVATLVAVAALQWTFRRDTGATFVYGFNDAYHFGLHLFMASAWGLERGTSFNGPAWSVSVEALLYLVFFVFALAAGRRLGWVAAVSAAALMAPDTLVVEGLQGFFIGGLVHGAYAGLRDRGRVDRATRWIFLLAALVWTLTVAAAYSAAWSRPLVQFAAAHAPRALERWGVAVLFPVTVLAVAVADHRWGTIGARLRWLGDISYSSYMIHFPLQLVVSLWVIHHGSDWRVVYRPNVLVAFLVALVALSLASHHGFERPLQSYLRKRLLMASPIPRPA